MISLTKFCCKSFSYGIWRNYSAQREARMMRKLLQKHSTSEKKDCKLSQEFFSNPKKESNKKLDALNKVFGEELMELIQTGENIQNMKDLGIEISKVKLGYNRAHLKVFWILKNKESDLEKINESLITTAGNLRKEISSARYLSRVPEIVFVRDLSLERSLEVEKLLDIADLGRDFKATHPSRDCSAIATIGSERSLPIMRQDVLGLNREEIENKILYSIARSKAIALPEGDFSSDEEDQTQIVPFDKSLALKFSRRLKADELKIIQQVEELGSTKPREDYEDDDDDDENEFDFSYDVEQNFENLYESNKEEIAMYEQYLKENERMLGLSEETSPDETNKT